MMKFIACTVVLFFGITCFAEDRLNFKTNGFSIAPLEGTSDTSTYQAAILFLPPTNGFAPNVNVQIQPYNGTLQEFIALSQKQFVAGGFTVLNEKTTKTHVTWGYSGTLQGRKLHWYASAHYKQNKIYLVTATATESQWETVSVKLKECVDSFKLEDVEP